MLGVERRQMLLEAVNRQGVLSIAQAERTLKVSRMTIHRDIEALSAEGLVKKIHGGVLALSPEGDALRPGRPARAPLPYSERQPAASAAKKSIAKQLLELTQNARTLILDASTTAHVFGLELAALRAQSSSKDTPKNGDDANSVFVLCGGLPLFLELQPYHRHGLRCALHGGEPHPLTGSLVGPIALAGVRELRADWAILSAAGVVEEEGMAFEGTPEESEIKRAALKSARQAVLAIDKSKLGCSAPYRLAALVEFSVVLTEDGPLNVSAKKKKR